MILACKGASPEYRLDSRGICPEDPGSTNWAVTDGFAESRIWISHFAEGKSGLGGCCFAYQKTLSAIFTDRAARERTSVNKLPCWSICQHQFGVSNLGQREEGWIFILFDYGFCWLPLFRWKQGQMPIFHLVSTFVYSLATSCFLQVESFARKEGVVGKNRYEYDIHNG